MRVLFDTSVLVAATVEAHAHHQRVIPWIKKALGGDLDLLVCAHSLAELYHVLASRPSHPRVSPMEARATIQFVVKAAVEVPYLSGLEYLSIIEQLAGMGLGGGIVFDAILVAAARKCKADNILTLNPTHFHRIWPDGRDKIIAP